MTTELKTCINCHAWFTSNDPDDIVCLVCDHRTDQRWARDIVDADFTLPQLLHLRIKFLTTIHRVVILGFE